MPRFTIVQRIIVFKIGDGRGVLTNYFYFGPLLLGEKEKALESYQQLAKNLLNIGRFHLCTT